ncbi:DUF3379 domain-containing protein [Shewanella carassii]|uniref:DUF3379 domain-containing protein n=1 Tax=Shewanella carassii TaxID=1987584 RepID=A0ABQ1T1C2_9GAMM|nr:DUF3379 domain-containing protein [Shewanella carassii]BCV67081.1 hypothetical protein TUM17387_24400 [Shewanella carassii]GGE79168.1 hypothetical protein GCM10011520_19640 [Shewanella carassii]
MDELKFRRQAYGDPYNQDPEFLDALAQSESNRAFVAELKALDDKINSALKLPVPENLAEKLLLKQQLAVHHNQRKRTGWMLAMAASVAFVAGVSFSLWRQGPVDLGQHALAHVRHETMAMTSNADISYQAINAELASLKGLETVRFNSQPGRVFYSTFCDFQGIESIHLVLAGERGKVTVFIVPPEHRVMLAEAFADSEYRGEAVKTDSAYLVLVAEYPQDIEKIKKEIKQSFI